MEAIILANRLKYELADIKNYSQFKLEINEQKPLEWFILFDGEEKTLYENEKFKLKFEFPKGYVNKYLI